MIYPKTASNKYIYLLLPVCDALQLSLSVLILISKDNKLGMSETRVNALIGYTSRRGSLVVVLGGRELNV